MLPYVSVVIPVRNDAAALGRCLRAIADNDYPAARYEVIVCDNGSVDASRDVAMRAGCRVFVVRWRKVGELRNLAAAQARGDILAFIDADHEIAGDWLRSAVDALARPGVGAAGAHYHAPSPATWVQRAADALRDRRPGRHRVDWLPSGNLVVWRATFAEIGGFDVTLDACEDVDFCRRLRAGGYQLIANSRMRSRHAGDPETLGRLFRAELWRGRDNIRVSLRRPLSWRSLVSASIPVAQLAAPCAAALLLAVFRQRGAALAAAGLAVPMALSLARAVRTATGRGRETGAPAIDALLVAFTYDAARALALVVNVGHRNRRR